MSEWIDGYTFQTATDIPQQKLIFEVLTSDQKFLFALIYDEITKKTVVHFGPYMHKFEIEPAELKAIIDKAQAKLLTWAENVKDNEVRLYVVKEESPRKFTFRTKEDLDSALFVCEITDQNNSLQFPIILNKRTQNFVASFNQFFESDPDELKSILDQAQRKLLDLV